MVGVKDGQARRGKKVGLDFPQNEDRRGKRGRGSKGVRVGEAKKPGPYSEGGAASSGGNAWTHVGHGQWKKEGLKRGSPTKETKEGGEASGATKEGSQQKKRRASDLDTADGVDIFAQLEMELEHAERRDNAVVDVDITAAFGEPPMEEQMREMATDPWDAGVMAADGFGGGMEKGFTDGKVEFGPGFGPFVQLYQEMEDTAGGGGLRDILPGDAAPEPEESISIDHVGYRQWEACMRQAEGPRPTQGSTHGKRRTSRKSARNGES